MALDGRGEYVDGGSEVRDALGRPVWVLVPEHAAMLPTDTYRAATAPADADGRLQIVLGNAPYAVANGFTDVAVRAAVAALPLIQHPTLGAIHWGVVILPPGVYTFSAPVVLPSYVTIDGLQRAILTRANGYSGLLFSTAAAVDQVALNNLVWDNGGTANLMWELSNGSTSIGHQWARYQNTSGNVFQLDGGAANNYDVNVRDVRVYAVGSPSNQNSSKFYDCVNLSVKGYKSLIQSGTSALSALDMQALGSAPTCRNWNVEDVEIDRSNSTGIFVRNNNSGVLEDVTVKGVRGNGIGTNVNQKGLVDAGEQVVGTAGQSTTVGIHVEDVEGRDWWGALVNIGSAQSNGGNVYDWSVSDIRGDASKADGSGVDTTRTNTVLLIAGAQNGTIDGVVARNTGLGGVRFVTTAFQAPAHIRATNIDVESCVQNPTGGGWHETGIFMDSGVFDITFDNPRSVNNYSAANPGGAQVGAGIGSAASSSTTQPNDITINNPVCTDTRAGGSNFQDVGIRIGESDADAWQPNRWTILGGNLSGNAVAPIYGLRGTAQQYATSYHGHQVRGVRGYNPVGVVTYAVPATGVAVPAVDEDRTFYVTAAAGGGVTMAIQGGPSVVIPASAVVAVRVPAGQTVTPTFTSAPTWVVEVE